MQNPEKMKDSLEDGGEEASVSTKAPGDTGREHQGNRTQGGTRGTSGHCLCNISVNRILFRKNVDLRACGRPGRTRVQAGRGRRAAAPAACREAERGGAWTHAVLGEGGGPASLPRRGLSLPLGGFPPPRETGAVQGGNPATHKFPHERPPMTLGTRSELTAAAAVRTRPSQE